MPSAVSLVDFYNCELDHNGLFTCDFSNGVTSESGKTASGSARDSYFSLPDGNLATKICSMTGCTFIRKDMTLTVNQNADYLNDNGVNYCRFENPAGAGNDSGQVRWYYCFITKIEYVAPETSRCYLQTDVFTTYFDVINLNQCMVEREHVYNDAVFTHTLPEPTPTIEHENRLLDGEQWNFFNCIPVFGISNAGSDEEEGEEVIRDLNNVGWIPTPGICLGCDSEYLLDLIDMIVQDGRQVIWSAFVPRDMCSLTQTSNEHIYIVSEHSSYNTVNINGIAHGYVTYGEGAGATTHYIRNNKISCYPFCSYQLTDLWNQSVVLKPEDMGGDEFTKVSNLGAAPCLSIYPKDYRGGLPTENAINVTDFSIVPYEVSYFSQYTALNKNQLRVSQIKDDWTVAKAIIDAPKAIMKGAAGDITGGVDTVMNPMFSHFEREAMLSDMKQRPPITANPPAGNVKLGNTTLGYGIVESVPKLEHIEILDDFFDRYGYNVSDVKTPAWNTRAYWNYIKTDGACMSGRVPVDDLKKLNALFDAGITIFHNAASYGQYTGNAANNRAPIH